jgi:parallel beta-helix repeat protein
LNNSFPGSGTQEDPIHIEGFEITSSNNLISISGTTLYLVISNNVLTGSSTFNRGIYLYNVIHATVVNNTVSACGNAIEFSSASNNFITNNTVFNNLYNGIKIVTSSNNNTISMNSISNSNLENGIWVHSSSHNLISNNVVYNTDDGIRLLGNSNYNLIVNNTCFENRWVGIRIGQPAGHFNIISHNVVHNNIEEGIKIEGPDISTINELANNIIFANKRSGILVVSSLTTIIRENVVYNNYENGIQISSSNNSIISNNVISNNKNTGISIAIFSDTNLVNHNDIQGNDNGNAYDNGFNSFFRDNYWSDLTETDVYTIEGLGGSSDTTPLASPFHLSIPVLTSPITKELTQTELISWNKSEDVFHHSLTYNILYSEDSQMTWSLLSSNLTATSYTWDTSTYYNGTEIFLKIQVIDSLGFVTGSISADSYIIINPDLLESKTAPSYSFLVVLLTLCSLLLIRRSFREII